MVDTQKTRIHHGRLTRRAIAAKTITALSDLIARYRKERGSHRPGPL